MRWILFLALGVAGCAVTSNVVVCEDGRTCPEDTTCNDQLGVCVTKQQAEACGGVADGLACDVTAADEVCFQGVCLPSLCGDGIIAPDEICDDSNRVGGDGCSARCDSTEMCGNGVADLELGEDCDDRNRLEHDGCSSTCKAETPKWFQRPLALPARMSTGIAYDSKRDRIIVIGGHAIRVLPGGAQGVELEDAWEWDGRWHEPSFQPPPPPQNNAFAFQLTYDDKHDRTLFYKGNTGDYESGAELWASDGTTWTQIWQQATSGGVSNGPNVVQTVTAYDPVHDQLVVHGGVTYDGFSLVETSDTWLWHESTKTWSKLTNTASGIDQTRTAAAMAFDPKRGKIVMYGGLTNNSTVLNDLWELDGTTWTSQSVTGGPAAGRFAASLAWNTSCQCLVLFGGGTNTSDAVTNQTFTRTGTTWANISATANPPPARSYPALASDGHGRNVLVGGNKFTSLRTDDAAAYFEDQWIFDGETKTWHEERGFKFSSAATDTDRHRIVFYGGDDIASAGEFDPSTYELSEAGLELRTTGTPDASRGGVIAYDEERRETVLVGGVGQSGVNTTTYVWNGTSWAARGALPTALQQLFPIVVYDAARKEIVAFGGCVDDVCNDETWTWNGTAWTQKTPATKPPGRFLAGSGYDRVNGRVVMFSGFDGGLGAALGDTWTWDGTTWTRIATSVAPSTRLPMIAWDAARQRLVLLAGSYINAWEWTGTDWSSLGDLGLHPQPSGAYAFSGYDGAGIAYTGGETNGVSGTWELLWTSDHDDDTCRLAEEHDGDLAAGCLDPDCWEVCTPSCLPGDTCDPAAAACGDGACGAAESCRSCPADCASCGSVCGDGTCDSGEACPGDCS